MSIRLSVAMASGLMLMACVHSSHVPAAGEPSDGGLAAVVRQLVVDSLAAGGRRADQELLIQDDAATDSLLRAAGLEFLHFSHVPSPVCPGSTDSAGAAVRGSVGYVVQAQLSRGADAGRRRVAITKTCTFGFRGRWRPFLEAGTWELRVRNGGWAVSQTLSREIT